jgi:hypothetical protein
LPGKGFLEIGGILIFGNLPLYGSIIVFLMSESHEMGPIQRDTVRPELLLSGIDKRIMAV